MKQFFSVLPALWMAAVPLMGKGSAESFFASREITRDANVGVMVVDVQSGEVVDACGQNRLLPPASTLKLLTTCTALELWGADYRFVTLIEADGTLSDGVLHGNLYVRGTGDPTISSEKMGDSRLLEHWADRIKALGIRRITGNVTADLTMWDNDEAVNPGWLWKDMGNYYAMGVYPLSYRDNTLKLYLQSGPEGTDAPLLDTDPKLPELTIRSHVRCTGVTYDNAYVYGAPGSSERWVTGEIPAGRGRFRVKADLPDPALSLVRELTTRLQTAGVQVDGTAVCRKDGFDPQAYRQRRTLFVHESPALGEIVREINLHSNNLYAESVFRSLGMRDDTPATVAMSLQRIQDFWMEKGVDISRSILVDGCGLSPQNGLAPATLTALLCYMYRSAWAEVFQKSLAEAGASGTLRNFLAGTPLQHRVYAKSGTIDHLKSYAGYLLLPDGRVLAFSVVVHNAHGSNAEVQRLIEQYLLTLAR